MQDIGLSSMCTVLGIMAGTLTVLSACGVFQYIKNSDSRKKTIIRTVLLLIVTALLFTGSYLLFPKCPACDKPMTSEFCTDCGARVQEDYPVCPNCNVDVTTDFCGTCGRNMKGE